MAYFYNFPGCCAAQILSGVDSLKGVKDLAQAHMTTFVLAYEKGAEYRSYPPDWEEQMKKLGFRRVGTLNVAHRKGQRLGLWVAGGEFEVVEEKKG